MPSWRLDDQKGELRLVAVSRRALGSAEFTWADLLYRQLSAVRVYAIYFPSRFDLALDASVRAALGAFGRATGPDTSVNFWDPTDPEFSRALTFFDVPTPPALVLARGQRPDPPRASEWDPARLYSIALTDAATLGDHERLAAAVNCAHEVLMRGDPREIARFVRARDAGRLLSLIAGLAAGLRDEILKLKPKFGLPGGISIQLG